MRFKGTVNAVDISRILGEHFRMHCNFAVLWKQPPPILATVLASFLIVHSSPAAESKLVAPGPDGHLKYMPYNDRGDVIPDFSMCGYRGGGVKIPEAPVKATLSPFPGDTDDTKRIQAAIDDVSKLPPDKDGIRGAVLLKRGAYRCSGTLKISTSGVVLRGEGEGEKDTVITATAKKQSPLITVGGNSGPKKESATRQLVTDKYVPVGSRTITVADSGKFAVGQTVLVTRHSNTSWIHEIGMDRIQPRTSDPKSTRNWTPFDLEFDRVITAIDGNRITVDVPIVCAIEEKWGGGEIVRYTDVDRISQCGVENLRAISAYDRTKTAKFKDEEVFVDENHATYLVMFNNVKNAWARHLTAESFYHGVASLGGGSKWITVEDSTTLDPVSEITGGRRYPFSMNGQQNLLQRCKTRRARHAFVFGARVPGPNVFLDCQSEHDYATSEPHHRWSVGGLYDNVRADVAIQDRQWMGTGHGWAGANYVVWNGEGSLICEQPPTAQNFAIGFVGKRSKPAFERPTGWWESEGSHVEPRSLYLKQLEERTTGKR